MTILNVDHSAQRIIVVVDNAADRPDGTTGIYQKASVLGPIGAVLAGSGDARFAMGAHYAALTAMQNDGLDFDGLCAALPDYLLRLFNELQTVFAKSDAPQLVGGQSIVLVGQTAGGEMVAINFAHHTDPANPLCREFEPLRIEDAVLWQPMPAGFGADLWPNDQAEWLAAVRLQRQMAQAEYGSQFSAGGMLSIYTLSPGRIEIDCIDAAHAWSIA